jgi:hypothetical protein
VVRDAALASPSGVTDGGLPSFLGSISMMWLGDMALWEYNGQNVMH